MPLLSKIGLAVFMCLSLFMLACSIIRAAATHYQGALDAPWMSFWVHGEACIGVVMASITVYRSVLIGSGKQLGKVQKYLEKLIRSREPESVGQVNNQAGTTRSRFGRLLLSKIPTATLTGLATLFAESTRIQGPSGHMTNNSGLELGDADYHEHLRDTLYRSDPKATSGSDRQQSQESRH
ncbi:hypothetical protein PG997_007121 [Apiospora hydei]|uniref:Uncharacterized protein n=1 Tax=Apiospora hydei TaxID=1337664 RepID=A0ABR1WS34_9PEZI